MGVRVKGSGVENETALTAMYVHILQAISPAIFIRLEFESILDSCCSVQPEEAAPAPSVAVAPAAEGMLVVIVGNFLLWVCPLYNTRSQDHTLSPPTAAG